MGKATEPRSLYSNARASNEIRKIHGVGAPNQPSDCLGEIAELHGSQGCGYGQRQTYSTGIGL